MSADLEQDTKALLQSEAKNYLTASARPRSSDEKSFFILMGVRLLVKMVGWSLLR